MDRFVSAELMTKLFPENENSRFGSDLVNFQHEKSKKIRIE